MSDFEAKSAMNGAQGMVRTFIRHPNAANLLMVLMLIFGIYAVAKINTQFFPTVENSKISVTVAWSGASAQDVEINILAIIEPEVRFINGVKKLSSLAREGTAHVTVEFDENADMQEALSQVEAAVKAISTLPQDADAPVVYKAQFFDNVASLAVTGGASEKIKRIWAKRIRDDLVDRGIDKIEISGMRAREIHVEIPERQLRKLKMTIDDVSRVIKTNSRDIPSGNIDGQVERQLRSLAKGKTVEGLVNTEIKALPTGEKVKLKDIAEIKESYDLKANRGFSGGNVAIELDVRRAVTADTLKTAKILDEYLLEITPQLPDNIELKTYEVSAEYLAERISLLLRNGLGGLALVVITLFIFLNAKIAFWVAVGIPVALFATVGLMYVSGQSINMISLFGLIMMLGVIVDDAIVVGEHTDTRLKMGDSPFEAAENGVGMMFTPILAAMTTTIAAFAPMLLIRDVLGQIMGVLPLVVIAVIIASLLECFYILPGHLAHSMERIRAPKWSYWRQFFLALIIVTFLAAFPLHSLLGLEKQSSTVQALMASGTALLLSTIIEWFILSARRWTGSKNKPDDALNGTGQASWFRRNFDAGFARFRDGPFEKLVTLSFKWRYVTVSIAMALVMVIAVGLVRSDKVGFVFFPSPESENIRGIIVFDAGIPQDRASHAISEAENALYKAAVELAGDDKKLIKAVYVSFTSASRRGNTTAYIKVQLTSAEERTIRTPAIVKAWRKNVKLHPGMRRFVVFQARGGPPGRDVDVELQGENSSELKKASSKVISFLETLNGVSGLEDNLPYGKPELIMELTSRGAALGFNIEIIGRQVRNAFEGIVPFRYTVGDDEITVRVTQVMRHTGTGALRNFELTSPAGQFVPLSEVVTMRESQGFGSIRRRDGKSAVTVTGDVDTNVSDTGKVLEALKASGVLENISQEHNVKVKFGGRAEEQSNAFADLKIGVYIALFVIYVILAWVFGSYWRPFAIMLIIPFGMVGAVFGHWFMGMSLTVLSMMGLLGLSGILVNDSIILVTRLDERLSEGDDLEGAAVGASKDRLRAVLLTSLTTIGGLTPLMFEKSLQAQFLLPMAITIVFGLAMATLLVLFLVPAFVGIGQDVRSTLVGVFGQIRSKGV